MLSFLGSSDVHLPLGSGESSGIGTLLLLFGQMREQVLIITFLLHHMCSHIFVKIELTVVAELREPSSEHRNQIDLTNPVLALALVIVL